MGQLYSIKEETLRDIADSIRTVTDTTEEILVEEFADKILEGGNGGGGGQEDELIARTLTGSYTNDRVTTIGRGAFQYCKSLTNISFPQCTTIGIEAFRTCNNLATVNFPQCTTISASAFAGCNGLNELQV